MRLIIDTKTIYTESDTTIVISPERGDNIYDLDKFVDHNSCHYINFVLADYVPTPKFSDYINCLSNKLAHKGQLLVTGTDAISVAGAFHRGQINVLELNRLVYGSRDSVWSFKQNLVSLQDIVDIMKLHKLKIIQKRLSDFTYSVVGERE